jgi:hypothetical protein
MFAVLLLVGIIFTGVGVAGATGKFDFFSFLKLSFGGGNPTLGSARG